MKYKKVIIFLTLVLGAAVFGKAGAFTANPRETIAVWQEAQAAPDKREPKESEKIAVVNLDEGVRGRTGQVNYAEKLSRFPSMDFEYTSLEAARAGLEAGRYGAYIIIPAVFSQNVESINSTPQVSQLEYAVNRSYSQERRYELLYNVQSYIDSLNDRLSYMYVDNILKEFHEAQDRADQVMDNDLKDKTAMERIEIGDLLVLEEVPDFQMEENTVEAPDISGYMEKNTVLANSMKEEYERSVKEIQAEAAELCAGGTALSERLNSLSEQTLAPDLTVDENGGSIIEKADSCLREELVRQSECILGKEEAVQYLRKLLENHQRLWEEWQKISGQPEQSVDQSGQSGDEPEQSIDGPGQSGSEFEQSARQKDLVLYTWLEAEEQEIRGFLEEIETAGNLDVEKIVELTRTEYAEPLKARAEAAAKVFRQRQEEGMNAVALYNEQLAGFQPQIDHLSVSRNVQEMADNNVRMQDTLLENSRAYMEYAGKSADSAREYADGLYKTIEEVRRKSDQAVADSLKEAQEMREKTSLENQRILGSFASKLPYTRTGRAENTLVYQFIVNPLTAEDRSEGQKKTSIETGSMLRAEDGAQDHLPDRSLNQAVSKIPDRRNSPKGVIYAAAGILTIAFVIQIYFFRRRRRYEY
jgi:uncharacterized phage infection (PIP) family protein YhgE